MEKKPASGNCLNGLDFSMKKYVQALESHYLKQSNPKKAFWMKKYMRNQFDYIGLASPIRNELKTEFIKANSKPGIEDIEEFISLCWQSPYREMQYTGMELTYSLRKQFPKEIIDVFEELITQKSWWDTIDYIAPSLAGSYFQKYPETKINYATKWMSCDNLWLKRSSIIFQLKYKNETDTDFLFHACKSLSGEKDFFIRKAIGWALRQYSKLDANAVISFVENNELSGLSKKEAMKWLERRKMD